MFLKQMVYHSPVVSGINAMYPQSMHFVCWSFVATISALLNFTCLQVSYQNKNPAYFANIKAFSVCHYLIRERHLMYRSV